MIEAFDNFLSILNEYWKPFIFWDGTEFSGLAVTLWILVLSLLIGFILALPLAIARVSKNRWISGPVWLFTYIFRGTPLYVQLLLIYSGLISLDFIKNNDTLNSFFMSGYNCVVLALMLNTLAYTIEIFAGFIKSMPHGEVEAAYAYGMSKAKIYRRIILPSALRRSLPAYSNEVILMLHSTSLAFTATVPDILKVARDANSATYLTFASYGTAALIYMVVSFSIVALFRMVERRALAFLAYEKK
ncbi:histidine/lysine/arginine/ornithine ABC transporter permease HisM [Pelistega indica]|uniref:Histidine/lysine/arginine/ornithine transport system permease protein HisM n=1 Tax=Pelistega indica TaxID=1414851 RepID=V8G2K5_9BURK|nr:MULTISPECIES: ABC transporter permease [Pelistega]ETD70754.1 histidine/lysine/arginine/ornithine ABC transporter permease HisM [Pelistega indica]